MRAVASFDLDSFDEDPPHFQEGTERHSRARIKKTFRGDLDGHGSVEMLAAQSEGGAGYVALERISGTLNGRVGSFSLLHMGTMVDGEMSAKWPVVPGSGAGELRAIRGEGRIDIDAEGRHTFTLDYDLD
jgi:uncharacterized protein DUF3224